MQEEIFALDIGTRSIIGIVGVQEEDMFRVLDVERMEHSTRAMRDGQIEDIEQVAKIANTVKKNLEERLGRTFEYVSVAAAGRALKTCRTSCEMELDSKDIITLQKIAELEMRGVEKAHKEIYDKDSDDVEFYCVGYSVMHYSLDDYNISTLLDHRGKNAKIEMIATFLPNEVVESLYASMSKIDLQIVSMTLEPIAAINAIIPQELRMLNLALVDIGAGTSDIALSDEGTVTAYTMATIAGDEITESIIKEYLVDFQTAEEIKTKISPNSQLIIYKDILGFEYSVSSDELLEKIRPALDTLCTVITDKIIEVNGKEPSAVFLVGGGSKIPYLCEVIADKLNLDRKKVVVGGNNYIKKVAISEKDISDPEYVTPLGIAITASMLNKQEGLSITVNGKKARLFKNNNLTVMDVLLMSGFKHNQIIGRSGKSVTFELNGNKRTVRGKYPVSAVIKINQLPASISTAVKSGDQIIVEPAIAGTDAQPKISDFVPTGVEAILLVNNMPVLPTYVVKDFDVVEIRETVSVDSANHMKITDISKRSDVSINADTEKSTVDFRSENNKTKSTKLGVPVVEPRKKAIDKPEEKDAKHDVILNVTLNGNAIELVPKSDFSPYLFVDMLNFVDIDPTKPQGNIILRVNGKQATYLQIIYQGDDIEIYWEK